MLERTLEPATDQPRVECVMAVLHEDSALCEAQERPARIPELRRANEHGAVDVMSPARVGIDRRPAVDQRVEEGERAVETESLGAELEDKEGRVSRRFDVDGDELSGIESGLRSQLRCIDGDLLPRHRLRCTARLEEHRFWNHGGGAKARCAQRTSSVVTALSNKTAAE
jgi:hypothetical protein